MTIMIAYTSRAHRDRDAKLMRQDGCSLRISSRPAIRRHCIHVANNDAFSRHMAEHGPVDRR